MPASEIVLSHIARKGWQMESGSSGWRIHPPGSETAYYLSFTPSWVALQAPLAAALSGDVSDPARLLRQNETMFMAKFGLDHTGTPLLMVEIPASGSVTLIDNALAAISRYAAVDAKDTPLPEESKARYFDEPPGIPHEVVFQYLKAVEPWGWGARTKPKGITWLLGYKGHRMFEVYLTITRSWAYFHIPAVSNAPASAAHRRAFLDYLLRVNDAWYMAKVGLTAADQVLVMLDIPTPELDFDLFRQVTRLLATYLDTYAREIQIMANLHADPRLSERIGAY